MKRIWHLWALLSVVAILCVAACSSGSASFSSGSGGATGFVTLNWQPPTTNADGTPISDLAGYRVYYGQSSGNYSHSIDVGMSTSCTIDQLPLGTTNYFAVTAYNSFGNESGFSGEASKTL